MGWHHPSEVAAADPGRIAYVMAATGQAVRYAELDARSNRLAHFWRAHGLAPGAVIALVLENHEWVFPLVWSAQRAGLLFVSLSTSLGIDDLAYVLQDCGAAFAVYSDRTAEHVEAALAKAPGAVGLRLDGDGGLIQRVAALPASPIADETMGLDMLYSSGTTGRPKGIRRAIDPGTAIDTAMPLDRLVEHRYGFTADTRYLCPAPLYHAAPLRWSMAVLRIGGLVVVMDRFDAEGALALIARHRITAAQWVPTHFVRMLKLPAEIRAAYDISSLRIAIHAAAPCPVPVKEAMIDWWGPILSEYYSATESNGFTAIDSAEWLERRGSVGRALIGTIRICDEDGRVLPPREAGDVWFEDGLPFTYHNDPAKTAAATNAQGWTTLGDVGWIDEDGYLYLTDRRHFMIISGGVNIYPQEIENLLITHPAVRDVAVIGIPDAEMGESVCAVVEPMPGQETGAELAEALRLFVRAKLGPVKAPRRIDFAESLPREPTGKLYKRLLRDQYRAEAQAG